MNSDTTFISKEGLQRFYSRIYQIFANKNHTHFGDQIDPATVSERGAVRPDGITIQVNEGGVISVPLAGTNQNGLMSSADKTKLNNIANNANNYSLPIATTSTLGGIKPDNITVTVDGNGVLHGVEQTPVATTEQLGKVKPDGVGITIDADGTIHNVSVTESDGTSAGPIVELTAKGHAEQASTTGKNLLIYPYTSADGERNGVTFTTLSGGAIHMSGTATQQVTFYIANGTTAYDDLSSSTISADGITSGVMLIAYSAAWGTLALLDSSKQSSTISGGIIKYIIVRISSGTTVNATIYPQLEAGSTATSYEPYTGGAPSPSPDYPQEIRVARGRNLLDESTMEDGYYVPATGAKASDSSISRTAGYIDVKPSTAYIASGHSSGSIRVFFYDKSKSFISTTLVTGAFTTPSNAAFITYQCSKSTIPSAHCLQIEEGSVATPYVPYGHVGLEAQGKNLAYSSDGNNKVIAHCEAGKTYTFSLVADYNMGVNLKKNSQSGDIVTHADSYMLPLTFTASDSFDLYINGWSNVSGSGFTAYNFQLNEGSTATPYEPYFHSTTPIPLPSRGWVAGLPDGTADTLTLDGAGKVTWELPTGDVVFNGSNDEGWVYNSGASLAIFGMNDSLPETVHGGYEGFVSAYRVYTGVYANWPDSSVYISSRGISQTNRTITVKDSVNAVGDSTWRSFLSESPMTVLYPLATPVTEEMGYVDLPEIPEGATLSIPELDALGVRYTVDAAASTLANQWYNRAYEELGDAIVDLAGKVTILEQKATMLEEKVTTLEGNE